MHRNAESVLLDIHVVTLTAFQHSEITDPETFVNVCLTKTLCEEKQQQKTLHLFFIILKQIKNQIQKKLMCIKTSAISGINDSIRKHFDFSFKMLTNLWLAEFRQRLIYQLSDYFPSALTDLFCLLRDQVLTTVRCKILDYMQDFLFQNDRFYDPGGFSAFTVLI